MKLVIVTISDSNTNKQAKIAIYFVNKMSELSCERFGKNSLEEIDSKIHQARGTCLMNSASQEVIF
mgnify:FL=1